MSNNCQVNFKKNIPLIDIINFFTYGTTIAIDCKYVKNLISY